MYHCYQLLVYGLCHQHCTPDMSVAAQTLPPHPPQHTHQSFVVDNAGPVLVLSHVQYVSSSWPCRFVLPALSVKATM